MYEVAWSVIDSGILGSWIVCKYKLHMCDGFLNLYTFAIHSVQPNLKFSTNEFVERGNTSLVGEYASARPFLGVRGMVKCDSRVLNLIRDTVDQLGATCRSFPSKPVNTLCMTFADVLAQ